MEGCFERYESTVIREYGYSGHAKYMLGVTYYIHQDLQVINCFNLVGVV